MLLTKENEQLLQRLPFSEPEKTRIRERWSETGNTAKTPLITEIFFHLLFPAILLILSASYFVEDAGLWINLAIFASWIIGFSTIFIALVLIALVMNLATNDSPDERRELLDRLFLQFGFSAHIHPWRAYYSLACWIALIGLTASLGYFVTASFLVIARLIFEFSSFGTRREIRKVLESISGEAR